MGSVASANYISHIQLIAGDIQPLWVIYWKRSKKNCISEAIGVRIKSKLRRQKIQTEGRVSCLEWLGERRQTGIYRKGKLDSGCRVFRVKEIARMLRWNGF